MSDVVIFEKRNKIAYVTINRPEKRNSLNHPVRMALAAAWREIRDDKDVWTAILTGAGEASFCAGGDLKENIQRARGEVTIPEMTAPDARAQQRYSTYFRHIGLYKPIIAAVNGYALAGGCEILSATDIRIASRTASFGLSEAQRGLVPGGGSMVRLVRQVPHCKAMEGVYYQRIRQSPDYDEGSAAFTERRRPDFEGQPTGANPKG